MKGSVVTVSSSSVIPVIMVSNEVMSVSFAPSSCTVYGISAASVITHSSRMFPLLCTRNSAKRGIGTSDDIF